MEDNYIAFNGPAVRRQLPWRCQMNVPDLRNVDFDAYRQRALDLRAEALQQSIDRAVNWLKAVANRRPQLGGRPAVHGATGAAGCTA